MSNKFITDWNGHNWVAIDAETREEIEGTRALSSSGAAKKAQAQGYSAWSWIDGVICASSPH